MIKLTLLSIIKKEAFKKSFIIQYNINNLAEITQLIIIVSKLLNVWLLSSENIYGRRGRSK